MDDTRAPHSARSLRPKERVVRRLVDDGMSESDVAWRFRRSPAHIQRILRLSAIDRASATTTPPSAASALERVVLRCRAEGVSHAELAARLRRSPGFISRVEQLAHLRATIAPTGGTPS
jgi:DNA-binding CsgD family transcriptional regulator